jgi:hypothetical protein
LDLLEGGNNGRYVAGWELNFSLSAFAVFSYWRYGNYRIIPVHVRVKKNQSGVLVVIVIYEVSAKGGENYAGINHGENLKGEKMGGLPALSAGQNEVLRANIGRDFGQKVFGFFALEKIVAAVAAFHGYGG